MGASEGEACNLQDIYTLPGSPPSAGAGQAPNRQPIVYDLNSQFRVGPRKIILDFDRISDTFGFCKRGVQVSDHLLIQHVAAQAASMTDRDQFLLDTARQIQAQFPRFNWVGYYFIKDSRLHVGPYLGKPTPHTIIDLNKGVCGAAVREGQTIVVDDVNADARYLACSLETRSEIVIPIQARGQIIGELDIDSEQLAAFGPDEQAALEAVAEIIGHFLESHP